MVMLLPKLYRQSIQATNFVEQAHLRNKIHNILINPPITHFFYTTIFFEASQANFVSSILAAAWIW